jgi:hypothetical protein
MVIVLQFPDRTFLVSASAVPIRTPDGELFGAVLAVTGGRELRPFQEERECLPTDVLHSVAELDVITNKLVIYDVVGHVVRTNAAADHLMKYQPKEREQTAAEHLFVLSLLGFYIR